MDSSAVSTRHFPELRAMDGFQSATTGLDQGPIVLMIEHYRSGFTWQLIRGCPYIVTGLGRAGFSGGWLRDYPQIDSSGVVKRKNPNSGN
jgi:hypothetical protein